MTSDGYLVSQSCVLSWGSCQFGDKNAQGQMCSRGKMWEKMFWFSEHGYGMVIPGRLARIGWYIREKCPEILTLYVLNFSEGT